jgi:hypothetical protein
MDIKRFDLLFKPFKHGFWKMKRCHGYRISLNDAFLKRGDESTATRARAKFRPYTHSLVNQAD